MAVQKSHKSKSKKTLKNIQTKILKKTSQQTKLNNFNLLLVKKPISNFINKISS